MATLTNFLLKPSPNLASITKISPSLYSNFPFEKSKQSIFKNLKTNKPLLITKATAAPDVEKKVAKSERVQKVNSMEELDEALKNAKNRLVVVEFAGKDSERSKNIYPFMVNLSKTCNDVDFLLVIGDETEKTKALCRREKIDKVILEIHTYYYVCFNLCDDSLKK